MITATAEVRAERRTSELRAKGRDVAYGRILEEIVARDARDKGRVNAPLAVPADAVVLDTSALNADDVFARAVGIVEAVRSQSRSAAIPPVSPGRTFG